MLARSGLPACGVPDGSAREPMSRSNVTQPCSRGFQGGDLCLHEKPCSCLRGATGCAWLPRWYPHQRVYIRVQGTMVNVTVGPVYNPDRVSLPLAHQICLGPHVTGSRPLPGGVCCPGGAQFEDTPVRTLTQLHPDMSVQAQKAIIGPVEALWYRALPNGCVEVCPLCKGDAGIGPLTDAVMMSVDQAAVLSDVHWRKDLGAVIVRGVLPRFRGLADQLGHQRGVPLEGVDHPLNLGQAALFVNPPTTWSASPDSEDHDGPYLVPAIPVCIEIHIDEKLDPGANRLMEMWKGLPRPKKVSLGSPVFQCTTCGTTRS